MTNEELCIMPKDERYSTFRTKRYCHRHEVFFGVRNRQKSIKNGLVVFLEPKMHNMSKKGVHQNREFDLYLKKIGQKAWQEYYNKNEEEFRKEFGRNYL